MMLKKEKEMSKLVQHIRLVKETSWIKNVKRSNEEIKTYM